MSLSFPSYDTEQSSYMLPVSLSVVLLCLLCFLNTLRTNLINRKIPIVGYRSILEPTWLVRLRFIRESRSIINEGYEKYRDSLFQVRRIGTEVLVLSSKYVTELRTLTNDANSSVEPFINDFVGDYTCGMVFLQSDLQNRVVQRKLTPNLALLFPEMKSELEFALQADIPSCHGRRVQVDVVTIFARIISRISARIFIGYKQGRNEEWLEATRQYTVNLFVTGMILRMFPRFIRPFVAPFLPSYQGLLANVAVGRHIVGQIVLSRRAMEETKGEKYEKPQDVLQWMMDAASGEETTPENLAQRMLILSLSSIHTTALTMAQALYDLCAHPEYLEPLRAELVQVLREDRGWQKNTLGRFLKLDSLLKESQRFNPVFLLTFNRIIHKPITFSDGITLHAGTRVAAPSNAMLQDPANVPSPPDPKEFDAFRYSRISEDTMSPQNASRQHFAMTNSSNMAFGYGKHACPGRFYASNEIKMILAHLLLKYDFEFPEGHCRPENFTIDTDMYPDPSAKLIMKRRHEIEDGICELFGGYPEAK